MTDRPLYLGTDVLTRPADLQRCSYMWLKASSARCDPWAISLQGCSEPAMDAAPMALVICHEHLESHPRLAEPDAPSTDRNLGCGDQQRALGTVRGSSRRSGWTHLRRYRRSGACRPGTRRCGWGRVASNWPALASDCQRSSAPPSKLRSIGDERPQPLVGAVLEDPRSVGLCVLFGVCRRSPLSTSSTSRLRCSQLHKTPIAEAGWVSRRR